LVGLAESDLVTGEELFQLEDRLLENPAGGELLVRFMRFYVNQDYSSHAVSIGDKLLRQSPEAFLNSLAGIQQSYKADLGEEATAHILQVLEEARKESPENKTTYDLIQVRWLDLAGQSGRALEYLGTLNAGSEVFLKERATLLFSMGRYDEAAEAYESLIVVSPQNITYYRQLGECLYRQDQTEKAMEVWERIPRIQSENPASYITLSEIYRLRGMTTPAAEALKKARELSGADAYEIDRRIMDLWAEEGNMPRLVQEFIHASQARKNREALYRYRLSEQFQEEQKATELLKEISRRLDSNPKFAVRTILLRLGTDILMASGQYDRAIGFVRTGYRGNPELALRLYQLGLDLLHRGAPEKTLVAWSYLPPQSPYYSHSQLQIAQLGLQAGELEKAEEAATTLVEDLIEKSPGKHLYTAGQPLSATGLRKHLTLLRGGNRQRMEDTLLILARIQLEKKKPGDALKWLLPLKKGGTVRAQSQPEVDLLLGHTYSQLGSLETAEEYYRRAREGYQGVPDKRGEAEYALAETLLWQERIPEALDTYLDLAKKDASLPQANESLRRYQVVSQSGAEQLYHYSLAGLFAWKGDREEAVRLYREAAADDAESDQAGWCLFEAAKILAADSQTDAAVKQIEYVLDRYENPTLLAECRTFLTSLDTAEAAEATVADGTNPYEQLILDFPSSIYSELARLKIEGRLEEPF
jgi:tetratricopeptide (TPR) repeat protein